MSNFTKFLEGLREKENKKNPLAFTDSRYQQVSIKKSAPPEKNTAKILKDKNTKQNTNKNRRRHSKKTRPKYSKPEIPADARLWEL